MRLFRGMFRVTKLHTGWYKFTHALTGDYANVRNTGRGWGVSLRDATRMPIHGMRHGEERGFRSYQQAADFVARELTEA